MTPKLGSRCFALADTFHCLMNHRCSRFHGSSRVARNLRPQHVQRGITGKDCGGTQNIQLFCKDNASRGTCYCCVDEAILKNHQVKVVVEIEESDIRPVALFGKVCVSALSSHFIHKGAIYPMAERMWFVQIIDTKKLSAKSSKLQQCLHLTDSVRRVLKCLRGVRIPEASSEFDHPRTLL